MAGILEYSTTAASNTAINAIGIQGTNAISNVDNAVRQAMADSASAITRHVTKAAGAHTAAKTDHNQFWRATGAVTLNLTAAATLTDGWCLWVKGDGGAITVDPNAAETINGAATLTVDDGASAFIVCTGATFFAVVSAPGDVTRTGTQTLTNKTLTAPVITAPNFSTTIALTGDITPAQITADQNDYAPTGHDTASVFRLASDTTRTITGIAGGADGRIIIIYNIGSSAINFAHESASSAAANRIQIIGTNTLVLYGGAFVSATFQYDATLSRWKLIAATTVSHAASGSEMEAGTVDYVAVTPLLAHRHPSAAKCWGEFQANSITILKSYNITSVADTATGIMTVTIATDFSDANWACFVSRSDAAGSGLVVSATYDDKTAGTVVIQSIVEAGALNDPDATTGNASWSLMGMGDL